MGENQLKFLDKRSRKAAQNLILDMAKLSSRDFTAQSTDAAVKRLLASKGVDFSRLVLHLRNPEENVPFFENILSATWDVPTGAKVSSVDRVTGSEIASVDGPGKLTMETYLGLFERSVLNRDRAVEENSYDDFKASISSGISSIEAFIRQQAHRWNTNNPEELLVDDKANKVSFDKKIDEWIPALSGELNFNKGDVVWQHFNELMKIRDDHDIHAKSISEAISYGELARLIGLHRTGIAAFLIELHKMMKERVPSIVIRARYAPDVVVKAES